MTVVGVLIENPSVIAAMVVAVAACLVACLLILADRQLRRLPRELLAVFLLSAGIATVSAQKRGEIQNFELRARVKNDSLVGITLNSQLLTLGLPDLPYRLECVTTNAEYSYERPTSGAVRGTWHLRGAYDDVTKVDLIDFAFPLGSELVTSLWARTWGAARAHLASTSNELIAVGAPMSAIPGVSRFWTASTPSNTYLLTWQDFASGRALPVLVPDPASLLSAQLELLPNGDFVARSNLVESVYRRVNPDDWDDDGWIDDEDPDPRFFNADGFGPHQVLPVGDDTNYYYWIDLVVEQANARVTLVGDGDSHLPDPDFIARAGETNRVMLLLGKSYEVQCAMPVRIVGMEDEEVEVQEGGRSASVVWPVYLDFVSLSPMLMTTPRLRTGTPHDGGMGVAVRPTRAAGGAFSWPDNFCCYLSAPDNTPVFICDGTCGCGGCSTGDITYEIGGYRMSYGGIDCGCSHGEGEADDPSSDPDAPDVSPSGPAVSVSFSKSAIIFEDAYTNSPGVVVDRRSTDTELTCEVYGGTNGGNYAFSIYNGERLLRKSGSYLPRSGTVAAGETFRIKIMYEAKAASGGVGDIIARGTFTEKGTGRELPLSEANLTAIKLSLLVDVDAPSDFCHNRHTYGVREKVFCVASPNLPICLTASNDATLESATSFRCPIHAAANPMQISYGTAVYTPQITVIEPNDVGASDVDYVLFGVPAWSAGGIGLKMSFVVKPLTVAFNGISIQEIPCSIGVQTGYFDNDYFHDERSHSVANGAGIWVDVGIGNLADGHDIAALSQPLPRMTPAGQITDDVSYGWIDGVNVWSVPFGWNVSGTTGTASPYSGFAPGKTQIFVVDSLGNTQVHKLDNSVRRNINGDIYLNGELQ